MNPMRAQLTMTSSCRLRVQTGRISPDRVIWQHMGLVWQKGLIGASLRRSGYSDISADAALTRAISFWKVATMASPSSEGKCRASLGNSLSQYRASVRFHGMKSACRTMRKRATRCLRIKSTFTGRGSAGFCGRSNRDGCCFIEILCYHFRAAISLHNLFLSTASILRKVCSRVNPGIFALPHHESSVLTGKQLIAEG